MTITLPRRPFVDAVAAVGHGDYVRLSIDDATTISLVGADMFTMVAVELRTAHPPDVVAVAATLPTKLLSGLCKTLGGDDVEVDAASSKLRLRSGPNRGEVAAQGRLPQVQAVPAEMWRQLSSEQAARLSQATRSAAVAALSDPARPGVSGVRVEVVGDSTTTVVGTDGARLHCIELRDVCSVESFTLPSQCVGAVCEALDEAEVRTVKAAKPKKGVVAVAVATSPPRLRIAVGANNIAVEVVYTDTTSPIRRRLVFCRRAPEPYSEWRRVAAVGVGVQTTLTLRRDVILAQLKTCPADAVSLTPGANMLQLDYVVLDDTSTRRLGEGGVVVDAVATASLKQFTVKVSTALLRDAVAQCGDEVEMSLTPASPCRLRSGSFSAVVMFVR